MKKKKKKKKKKIENFSGNIVKQNFSYQNEFGTRNLYTRCIIQMDPRNALLTGSTILIASLMRSR